MNISDVTIFNFDSKGKIESVKQGLIESEKVIAYAVLNMKEVNKEVSEGAKKGFENIIS